MAAGKAINKKSFYGSSEVGQTPDIAMPPLDEQTPIAQTAPNPWDAQQKEMAPVEQPLVGEAERDVQESSTIQQTDLQQEIVEPEKNIEPIIEKNTKSNKTAQESFKEIRIAKEKAEKERDVLLAQFIEMQNKLQAAQPKQPEVEEPDEFNIDPDAIVEGKQLKAVARKMKEMEKQLYKYQSQSQEVAIEAKLKAQFPDFEDVVSKENVEILNEQYPDIAKTLRETNDLYNKATSAYKIIKNFGIHKEAQKELLYGQDKAKALENVSKPRPLASVSPQQGDSPLSKANAFANGMTEELKAQLRKEMQSARRNL